MNVGNELTEYNASLPVISETNDNEYKREEIRIYKKNNHREILKVLSAYWRFASLAAAFAAIFFLFYLMFFEGNTHSSDDESTKCEESTVKLTEDTTNINSELVSSKPTRYPDIIDEAKTEIELVDYLGQDNAFESVLNNSAGIKVLIIHSHSSEKVSQSLSVIEAGEVIAQLLNSSGIKTLHFTELHDENGRIGAYNRMKDSIERLKDECPELILIIDLHGSEEGFPLMFDIGVSPDYAWKENLRIATVIYNKMDRDDCTVRLLPQELGQNTGILSLNVSIGNNNADDTVSRELIADLALGITLLFTENTPA